MYCRWLTIVVLLLLSGLSQADVRQDRLELRWRRSRPAIKQISVEGNEYFSESKIVGQLYSRKRTLWSSLKGDRRTRVQRETLNRDTLEVKYMYLREGFLGVQVSEQFRLIPKDSSAHVILTVDEGRQYFVGGRQLLGSYPSELHLDLHSRTGRIKDGHEIDYFDLRQTIFDLKTVMANNGYPYAEVTYDLDTGQTESTFPIRFQVQADSLVRFGRIGVVGLDRYAPKTAWRELKMFSGEIYRRDDLIDTRRRLLESGYFSTISIVQVDSTDRYRPEFEIRLRERKPMYTSFTTGIGRTEEAEVVWDISSGFGKRNFLGSRRYDALASAKFGVGDPKGLLEHRYRIRYTEPWLLKIRMPLVFTVEWEPGVKDPELDFRIERFAVSVSTTKRFGEEYLTRTGLEYEAVRIYGVAEDEIQEFKDQEELSVRRNLYVDFRRDSRDHLFVPTRGSVTEVSAKYFGGFLGGDEHFYKLQASWSSFQRVWPGWIAATRLKSGWAATFGESDLVPIDERFFLGGATTIRGFRVNTLGPRAADGTLLKSDFIAIFNQEFRWPTLQAHRLVPIISDLLGSWPLWQSVFVDIGNGFSDPDQSSFRKLAYTYGTGLQLHSPAGPIRIDYARRIKTDDIEFDSRWHFTILYAF